MASDDATTTRAASAPIAFIARYNRVSRIITPCFDEGAGLSAFDLRGAAFEAPRALRGDAGGPNGPGAP
jgi:hypothetical protein